VTESKLPSPVFLTGATGFIGARLTARLLEAGIAVAALVLPSEVAHVPEGLRAFPGDVTDASAVASAIQATRPALILHLAAVGITHPGLPAVDACRVNVAGTLHVLEAARKVGSARRIVLVGTSYEYGARRGDVGLDPFNAYSASKVAAWAFARAAYNAWAAPVVWARPFQVYGPGQRARALVPAAIHAALHGEDIRTTAGEQQRDFIFVEDVVAGLLAAAVAPGIEGRAVDLGTGRLRAVRDVVARIWELTAAEGRILAGALPYRPGEVSAIPADVARTRRLTGWTARVRLDEGLSRTIASMRERQASAR
jgi:nucleoside-diphosphate-sugar epimerase